MTDGVSDEPVRGRRHRLINVPAGLLMFVCLFLPAVQACDSPTYPLEVPMFATPYLLGLAVAAIALARRMRAARAGVYVLRVIFLVTIVGWAGALALATLKDLDAALAAIAVAVVGGVIAWLVTWNRGNWEQRAARTALIAAILDVGWFGLWSVSGDALIGVYLAAGASVALLVGALEWRREARPPVDPALAPARARR